MTKFKVGDRVKWKMPNGTEIFLGEITIPGDNESKVLPDGDYDWNYGYYPNEELELEKDKDAKSSD